MVEIAAANPGPDWNSLFSDLVARVACQNRTAEALAGLPATRASILEQWWLVDDGAPANVLWNSMVACLDCCNCQDFWDI